VAWAISSSGRSIIGAFVCRGRKWMPLLGPAVFGAMALCFVCVSSSIVLPRVVGRQFAIQNVRATIDDLSCLSTFTQGETHDCFLDDSPFFVLLQAPL
jgi:hypothetical protein